MTTRTVLTLLALCTFLASCGVPRMFDFLGADASGAKVQRIFMVTQRDRSEVVAETGSALQSLFGRERGDEVFHIRLDVSVPPSHVPGQIEWPVGQANPARHFAVADEHVFEGEPDFRQALRAETPADPSAPVVIYIHGYNTTLPEAAYRLVQMMTDFDMGSTAILYAWPSAGRTGAYVYDKDSVLFARDDLVRLMRATVDATGRDLFIIAHSMGAQLTMEALRQTALIGDRAVLRRIEGVSLLSPDLDPDVFRRQVGVIGSDMPDRFHIYASKQDKALRISNLLSGGRGRIGQIIEAETFADLPVTVIDVSAFAKGSGLDHMIQVTQPDAIDRIRVLLQDEGFLQGQFGSYLRLEQAPQPTTEEER